MHIRALRACATGGLLLALACDDTRAPRGITPSGGGGNASDAGSSDTSVAADAGHESTPDAGFRVDTGVPAGPSPLVYGLSITAVAIYQGVRVDVVRDGAAVARRNAPVIAGRPGLLRVFVSPQPGWQPRTVVARLSLNGREETAQKAVSAASIEENTDTTFNFYFDETALAVTTQLSIALEEGPGVPMVGPPSNARYPAQGTAPLGAVDSGGPVEVVLVPVQYEFDGSSRLPDVTPAQIERYRAGMFALYPARAVEITVRSPMMWSNEVHPYGNGWSTLLQAVLNLRQRDNVATNVYYYGAVQPQSSFERYCRGGCVAGLSTLSSNPNNDFVRGSIGLGFSGDNAVGTFVHEVGHAHGRQHAPCQVQDADPSYPYPDANLGVWGYDIASRRLVSPTRYKDMMSYCDPRWISDYQYDALYDRISYVNSIAALSAPAGAPTRWRAVLLDGAGNAEWGEPVTLKTRPGGEPHPVTLTDRYGRILGQVEGELMPFGDLPGGILMFPEPEAAYAITLPGVSKPLPL